MNRLDAFEYHNPTRVFYGPGSWGQVHPSLRLFGTRALVIAGRNSLRAHTAWDDARRALETGGLTWVLETSVEPNPSFETVERLACLGREAGVDCIVGIGGGSPLDAAKAVAVLIAHPEMTAEHLYQPPYARPPLPVLAVPTTAGTGSEVTPYAVLTDHVRSTKRAMADASLFPRLAVVDPRYTHALPLDVTRDTALDAFSHLVEGYLARKATPMSDALAEEGLRQWGLVRSALERSELTPAERDGLMRVSLLGGWVIATAATATVHALGFPLTYFHNLPHGRANGYLLAAHLERCCSVTPKVNAILKLGQWASLADLRAWLHSVLGPLPFSPRDVDVVKYAQMALPSKNHLNNPYPIDLEGLKQLLIQSLKT